MLYKGKLLILIMSMHPWFRGDRVYTTNVMVRWVSSNLQHYERGYTGNVPLSRTRTFWNAGKKPDSGGKSRID